MLRLPCTTIQGSFRPASSCRQRSENVPGPVLPATQKQIYEITALAVLPNGSQKLLQYVVHAGQLWPQFSRSPDSGGQVGNFQGANSNQYRMNGTDGSGNPPRFPAAPFRTLQRKCSIAVSPGLDTGKPLRSYQPAYVTNSLPRPDHYTGAGGTPSVQSLVQTGSLTTPDSLDQLVQTLKANADVVMGPNPPVGPTYNNSGTVYNYGQSGPGYTGRQTCPLPIPRSFSLTAASTWVPTLGMDCWS